VVIVEMDGNSGDEGWLGRISMFMVFCKPNDGSLYAMCLVLNSREVKARTTGRCVEADFADLGIRSV
jgi:hypothetical protein